MFSTLLTVAAGFLLAMLFTNVGPVWATCSACVALAVIARSLATARARARTAATDQ